MCRVWLYKGCVLNVCFPSSFLRIATEELYSVWVWQSLATQKSPHLVSTDQHHPWLALVWVLLLQALFTLALMNIHEVVHVHNKECACIWLVVMFSFISGVSHWSILMTIHEMMCHLRHALRTVWACVCVTDDRLCFPSYPVLATNTCPRRVLQVSSFWRSGLITPAVVSLLATVLIN